ncbi:MAG: response regulator [Bacteroidota bacterium]
MAIRLLYADDEPALRELVQNHLSLEGFEVDTVADGIEAVDQMKKSTYDLVLLDVHMPRMDGVEVLKYMKLHKIPSRLIMLTGDGDPHIVSECAKYGAQDYLTKPYNYHELIEAIDRVMTDSSSR